MSLAEVYPTLRCADTYLDPFSAARTPFGYPLAVISAPRQHTSSFAIPPVNPSDAMSPEVTIEGMEDTRWRHQLMRATALARARARREAEDAKAEYDDVEAGSAVHSAPGAVNAAGFPTTAGLAPRGLKRAATTPVTRVHIAPHPPHDRYPVSVDPDILQRPSHKPPSYAFVPDELAVKEMYVGIPGCAAVVPSSSHHGTQCCCRIQSDQEGSRCRSEAGSRGFGICVDAGCAGRHSSADAHGTPSITFYTCLITCYRRI